MTAELLTSAQMRAIEQAAISSGRVTGLELMESAGQGVVQALCDHWPDLAQTSHRALVLAGPGNNGGDGFVVARVLAERGWEVALYLLGDADRLPPDARTNCDRWTEIGAVHGWGALDGAARADLVVDAVFGTGLSRPLDAAVAGPLIAAVSRGDGPARARVVAVDVPTGLDADSGKPMGQAVRADLTVSFHRAKHGHVLAQGPAYCGHLVVHDIGLTDIGLTGASHSSLREARAAVPAKSQPDHKYAHGHALIVAGGSGKGGAARLAARGALRIGAGLVTVAPTPGALQENTAQLNAIMLRPVGDAPAFEEILTDERLNALCLGPGLGVERALALVPPALAVRRPLVLDADALSAFQPDPQTLFAGLHDRCVLTPHTGEFARLFPDLADHLDAPAVTGPAFSKVDATRAAAQRAGCTVLFKGPDTVIADQTGACVVNVSAYDRAVPWLATAGSGDVLAGYVTGLLARGLGAFEAAEAAAWLHTECARAFGPGLIAEDLPDVLPNVFRALGL